MSDNTDGCTNKYRCAKALYLLSCLASEFDIIIDRLVDAPGHGKDLHWHREGDVPAIWQRRTSNTE